jgi:hypothetical protein
MVTLVLTLKAGTEWDRGDAEPRAVRMARRSMEVVGVRCIFTWTRGGWSRLRDLNRVSWGILLS